MQYYKKQIVYSPTDLVNFLGCRHASFLDVKNLDNTIAAPEASATNQLWQNKGLEHENAYLNHLRESGKSIVEIVKNMPLQERAAHTISAMRSGVDVIYQGAFFDSPWRGDADFLIKCNAPSTLGNYSYKVLDTKLARSAEPKHIIQICAYSQLLEKLQERRPDALHLFLGNNELHSFKLTDFSYYYSHAKQRFEQYIGNLPTTSYPEPCEHCALCRWQDNCTAQWKADDHLSFVANIKQTQIEKLRECGIKTVAALATSAVETKIVALHDDVFQRLRSQAALQHHRLLTGEDKYEILPFPQGKGLSRIPLPDPGDLFFDMEGDPLYPKGLEYLFGIYYLNNGQKVFLPFWAHDHNEEKETFKRFMAFVEEHLAKYPQAYIYHYNHYETTALKKLAGRYAVCEEQLDNLLRQNKFVDLYVVVRESIRTSEPGYSIKNLETFYMEKRENAVANAGDSIIVYNQWRETGDNKLLQEIADYNEVDCISTNLLRDWFLKLKPDDVPFFNGMTEPEPSEELQRKDWEIQSEDYQKRLEAVMGNQPETCERLTHILEFHNREAKPQWWSSFERQNKFADELIDDTECLGGLELISKPEPDKRSLIYTYRFPPQEYKLRIGSQVVDVALMKSAGTIVDLDEQACIVKLRYGVKQNPLPAQLSVGPSGPIDSKIIRAAIYRYANYVLEQQGMPHVASEILSKNLPHIKGKQSGEPIITSGDFEGDAFKAVAGLKNSYLFIQGPPGAGKTYISAHIIVELIKLGKKIGIASNSHKAIHNLLEQLETMAMTKGISFSGIKKASSEDTTFNGNFFSNTTKTENMNLAADIFAGTAWTFANPHFNKALDYLFIDEAGQVSTANVIAMSIATENIVLVGDQMQLGQPTQGMHPGEAGLSVLEFLLGEHSTISPERGIFLKQTRRLRPEICKFISDAFYDSRLQAHESTVKRHLNLQNIDLPNAGIVMLPVEHTGCSQKSVEEGNVVKQKYEDLLGQKFTGADGVERVISIDDILVVAPYNVQVNYLQSILPHNARVGTVDKFQGQEAPIVLISMVTSSAENMPRNIEFLYSRNRLNVALSRAQCLAVVVLNPNLLEILCKTVEQMKLINAFCWLEDYAKVL